MSAIAISVFELPAKVQEVITGLKRDDEVVITGCENQVVAKLIPVNEQSNEEPKAKLQPRQLGMSNSVIWISPDFDEPLEDLSFYENPTVNGRPPNDQPISKPPKTKRRYAGTAEGEFWMSSDFDAPLEEFKEYME